ncbi:MAG: GGDEF domain-containing protein [Oscillospiraceae bacterium]|nr:GGDEF domain-containing protein [Oscillospiraceae bacterium]
MRPEDSAAPSRIYNIAVMVAGTDEEYQSSVLSGIAEAAKLYDLNISVFASFGGVLVSEQNDIGEYNIYSLIDYEHFDGAILLTNTIYNTDVRRRICRSVIHAGIPAVILDSDEYPEFYNIRIDNSVAMRQIVEHVIEKHNAKIINFISGPLDNPEAAARYQTFLDVTAEHGISVDPERIYFGTFRPIDGMRAVDALLRSGKPLPDAIIAANDAMALEAVSVLTDNGIRVPEDVIVTGFDWTYFAQHHNPSLTSVSRPLDAAGRAACELLARIFRGEQCEKTVSLNAAPVYVESCGCRTANDVDMRSYKTMTYEQIQRFRSGTSLLSRMTAALSVNETPEDSIRIISQYLYEINCEQCCICLCDNWENAFQESGEQHKENCRIYGYTETMSAPLVWNHGDMQRVDAFPSRQMYPVPFKEGGNISYFFPMHFRERCLGYYIFTNTEFPTKSMLCHLLMINISHSFENIRKLQNLDHAIRELDRLYVIDPLCGIYNRTGFLRKADDLFRESCAKHENIMISFIDMDGLKLVNDNYGHDEGDFALRRLAAAIRENCTGNQICARFGGDEFIAIGTGFSQEDADDFEARFTSSMEQADKELNKPYKLSASIGTFLTEASPEMKLFTLISQADKIMYERKKLKHSSRYLG